MTNVIGIKRKMLYISINKQTNTITMKDLLKTLAVVLAAVLVLVLVGCSTPPLEEDTLSLTESRVRVCTRYWVEDFTTYQFESQEAVFRAATIFRRVDWFYITDFEEYILNSDSGYVGIIDEHQKKEAIHIETLVATLDIDPMYAYDNDEYRLSHKLIVPALYSKHWILIVKHSYATRECNF
jgi:hypothetical protein